MVLIVAVSICVGLNLGGILYSKNKSGSIFAFAISVIALVVNLI